MPKFNYEPRTILDLGYKLAYLSHTNSYDSKYPPEILDKIDQAIDTLNQAESMMTLINKLCNLEIDRQSFLVCWPNVYGGVPNYLKRAEKEGKI